VQCGCQELQILQPLNIKLYVRNDFMEYACKERKKERKKDPEIRTQLGNILNMTSNNLVSHKLMR
jgi:hypothetical protein